MLLWNYHSSASTKSVYSFMTIASLCTAAFLALALSSWSIALLASSFACTSASVGLVEVTLFFIIPAQMLYRTLVMHGQSDILLYCLNCLHLLSLILSCLEHFILVLHSHARLQHFVKEYFVVRYSSVLTNSCISLSLHSFTNIFSKLEFSTSGMFFNL